MSHEHPRVLMHEILAKKRFAVVGASRDPEKYGYKVYMTLKELGYTVYPVNPNADEIDGDSVYPTLDNLPEPVDCIVSVVPPGAGFDLARMAGHLRIPFLWFQPGSDSESAVIEAQAQGVQVIYGGACIMVEARAYQSDKS